MPPCRGAPTLKYFLTTRSALVCIRALAAGVTPFRKRQLTLNEVMGALGPLEVLVNNSKWDAPTTESPVVGSTEAWEIINLTADAHPIHLHLVQLHLLNKHTFNTTAFLKAYKALFPGGGLDPMTGLLLPAAGGGSFRHEENDTPAVVACIERNAQGPAMLPGLVRCWPSPHHRQARVDRVYALVR